MPTGQTGRADTSGGQSTDPLTNAADQVMSSANTIPTSGGGGSPTLSPQETAQLLDQLYKRNAGYGGPMTSMQTTYTQPQLPQRPFHVPTPEVAQGPFVASGQRKRADSQAMMNDLAGLVNAVQDYNYEKKVKQQGAIIEKMMSAQQGSIDAQGEIDQATQIGKMQVPAGATEEQKQQIQDIKMKAAARLQRAQDQFTHNQDILSELMGDPKNLKMLEKAFNVKLIGDDKNKKSPEYQGLLSAMKNKDKERQKEAGLSMMEKFNRQQPIRQQVTPGYAQYVQQIKDKAVAEANEQARATTDMTKAVMEADSKHYDRASKEQVANMLVGAKDRATAMSYIRVLAQNANRKEVAGILSMAAMKREQMRVSAMINDTRIRAASELLKAQEKTKQSDSMSKIIGAYQKELDGITRALDQNEKSLGAAIPDFWSNKEERRKFEELKNQNEELRQRRDNLFKKIDQLGLGAPISDASPTGQPGYGPAGGTGIQSNIGQAVSGGYEPDSEGDDPVAAYDYIYGSGSSSTASQ